MGAAVTPRGERERWIKKYQGLFGEPFQLIEYREGTITFRELYDSAIRSAENLLATAQAIHSAAFLEGESRG